MNGMLRSMIDQEYLQQTLFDLLRIDSRNPTLSPDAPGEAQAGRYVAKALKTLGLECFTHELAQNRVNVVGRLPGAGGGRSLMLNGHLDTVGVDAMTEPFTPVLNEGKVYGRGAQDMKASLAAMLSVARALIEHRIQLDGDLILSFVADEEARSIGMEDLVRRYHTDAAIVTEPTDMKLCRAHRGFVWLELNCYGKAAHGSRYQDGIDANIRMGRILSKLDGLSASLLERQPHPLAGPPSLHVAQLQGGTEASTYAAHAWALIERRTIPGDTPAACLEEIQNIIDELAAKDAAFHAEVTLTFERQPYELAADSDIVKVLESVMRRQLGTFSEHTGATFWTDAALLQAAGIDTVLLGPKGQGLHAAEEWVELKSAIELAEILLELTQHYCGTSSS